MLKKYVLGVPAVEVLQTTALTEGPGRLIIFMFIFFFSILLFCFLSLIFSIKLSISFYNFTLFL